MIFEELLATINRCSSFTSALPKESTSLPSCFMCGHPVKPPRTPRSETSLASSAPADRDTASHPLPCGHRRRRTSHCGSGRELSVAQLAAGFGRGLAGSRPTLCLVHRMSAARHPQRSERSPPDLLACRPCSRSRTEVARLPWPPSGSRSVL